MRYLLKEEVLQTTDDRSSSLPLLTLFVQGIQYSKYKELYIYSSHLYDNS